MSKPRQLSSGRWQARITVTEGGRTRQVSVGTFRTQREAKDAIVTEQARRRTGAWVDPSNRKTTVGEWSEQWYALRRAPNRKVRSFLDAQIKPHWGDYRLGEVTAMGVQQWINCLTAKGLAPATVRGLHGTFRQMLGKAVDYDLLTVNPCRGIDLPRQPDTEPVLLTVEQLNLIESVAPDRFKAMIHLASWAGLRWGECAALRWQDIDLEAGVVHVRRAMKHDGSFGPPKNGKIRKVLISPASVEVLRRHRRDFGSTELLFTTGGQRSGRPLNGMNFRANTWKAMMDAAGLDPRPTFHDLRHGHAGHMVMAGMDWKMLAERLGHHKPSFTMDRYGWLRPDKDEVTLLALEVAMAPKVDSP